MRIVRLLLRLTGKSERKVAAVFGSDPLSCHQAVVYLSQGVPDIPIWVFSTQQPLPQTVALCERVFVDRHSLALLIAAQRHLWTQSVALAVAAWTGKHRGRLLKLAPFLTPPFRVLLLNEHGDFFAGTPLCVLPHIRRRVRDRADTAWNLARGCWQLASYHVWRSGPVRRLKDQAGGSLLLAAAWLLRLSGNPHRWIFRNLHGGHALDLPADALDAYRPSILVERFSQSGEVWDGDAFEAFARASEARWILWLDHPDIPLQLENLLPAVEGRHTFAVSPQGHFRAWKPSLLPTAPFRALSARAGRMAVNIVGATGTEAESGDEVEESEPP